MDLEFALAHLSRTLDDGTIPGLPGHHKGKVRDSYDLGDGHRVMVASDRLSAFDRPLCAVPFKGQVLTGLARYWFDMTSDICANHVIRYPDPNVIVCQNLEMLPVEVVVRGYLAGTTNTSILPMYRAGAREVYGHHLPDGLADNSALPIPIVTPTTKESTSGHDEPLSAREVIDTGLMSADRWAEVSSTALALFARGQDIAMQRGLILADTKYEFGIDAADQLTLADEIHTPDSSRFWRAKGHEARIAKGESPASLDKDVIRAWVVNRCDPYTDSIPAIPDELIAATACAYVEAFERLTGKSFEPDLTGATVIDRISSRIQAP